MQVHQFLKIKFVLIFSFFTISAQSQEKDTLYFDADWKPSNKENHAFYRPMPLKQIGELVLIEDFYKNGNRQMQGYVLKDNQENYVGDIYYYNENGTDASSSQYYNTTQNQELTYYYPDGKLWKKIHYKDDVKDGNTLIYKKDETILMTSTYEKGQPISGDFITVKNVDDYYGDSLLEDTEYEHSAAVTVAPARIVEDTDYKEEVENATHNEEEYSPYIITEAEEVKEAELVEDMEEVEEEDIAILFEKKYWLDSNLLAQVKGYKRTAYGYKELELISQKNYDKSGKLLQDLKKGSLNYGNQVTNGIDYEYYTQNEFITGIKTTTPYVNEQISGKVISYFPNDKTSTITNYNEGYKNGETLEYSQLGVLLKKLVYKDNEPFDGHFSIPFDRDITIESTYKNGLQEGEAIAKTDSGAVVAKGIYKNGKPFQGTFFIKDYESYRDDKYEIINVVNFEKEGKQTTYDFDYLQPVETYTLKNGKKNGESVFYKDEKVVSTIIYKDNKPYEGVLTEKNEISTYKNGTMTQLVTSKSFQNEDQKITRQFENNLPTIATYKNQFIITEDPREEYIGIYKNGLPFDGYFYDNESEFKRVNLYKNGALIYQYSNDYLKNMERYVLPEYDIKSTYKDGKIVDGLEYILMDKSLIIKKWNKGILQTIDWDLFAVNYFNRIHFALIKDRIEITEYQSKGKIMISKKDNELLSELFLKDKIIASKTSRSVAVNDSLPKNGNRIYVIQDNSLKVYDQINNEIENNRANRYNSQDIDLLDKFYFNANFNANSVKGCFLEISKNFTSNETQPSPLKLLGMSDDSPMELGLQTDKNNKVARGIQITQNVDKTYNLQSFYDLKSIQKLKNVPFSKIESEVEKLYQTLQKVMNDKFNSSK